MTIETFDDLEPLSDVRSKINNNFQELDIRVNGNESRITSIESNPPVATVEPRWINYITEAQGITYLQEFNQGSIYLYEYAQESLYRYVPTVYNPILDAFYSDIGLTQLVVARATS